MYQALYRKWRPKTFDDVIGQEHITETLKRQISSGRLSHAYLFVGTRGTGKTTCAKILSRAINCLHPENGNPCNQCASCLGIENGSILDVLELDAASNNGVDNVRALREEAVFTPADVRKRVYIIDEVHMLSTAAFNALLKILEEPPEHLVFILATTEIHKVPATILSRCQRFTFKRILPEKVAERLLAIAGREGIELTPDAAALLARLSDGSLRDALSLLDQCASETIVDYDRVLSSIGLAGGEEITGILSAIADQDGAAALRLLDKLYMGGKVMASVLEELTGLVRDVLLTSLMPKGGVGLLSGGFDQAVLQGFAKRLTPEQLLSATDILRETAQDLSKSAGGRLAVELCLMRLCDPRLQTNVTSLLSRISQLEARLSGGVPAAASAVPSENRFIPPVTGTARVEIPGNAPVEADPKPAGQAGAEARERAAAAPASAEAQVLAEKGRPEKSEEKPARTPVGSTGDIWKGILSDIQSKIDIPQYTFLSDPTHSSAVLESDTLTIKAKNPFVFSMINNPAVIAALKESAAAVMQITAVVRITQEGDSVAGGSDKIDALSRFSGVVKFED